MKSDKMKQPWMDLADAAEYCNCSISYLRTQIKNGRLKYTRSGGEVGKILLRSEWLSEMLMAGARNG